MRYTCPASAVVLLLCAPVSLLAIDIEGVQVASMDQPRVSVMLHRAGQAEPLFSKGDAALAELLGLDKSAGDKVTSFSAFLDTGASGISISTQTADSLGIKRLSAGGKQIIFHDIGVGGTDQFNVSEPLSVSVGPYQALGLAGDAATFKGIGGPWNTQVGPLGGGGMLGMLMGGIDIVGMPAMAGKIVVIDARPVNTFSDTLRVQLIDPRSEKVSLPVTHRSVAMSYADFTAFTIIDPAGATRPISTANPFIGCAPSLPAGTTPERDITLTHNGKSSRAGWLLDTGAAASMISRRQALALGVRYKLAPDGSELTELEGVPKARQFTLTIGGVGGQKTAAGFYVDEMRVPTAEGDDLIYKPAPVLVVDITVVNPTTKQTITLDGVFGMNFLVASAEVTGGLIPDLGKMVEGPYDWIVIDHTKGVLSLALRKELRR